MERVNKAAKRTVGRRKTCRTSAAQLSTGASRRKDPRKAPPNRDKFPAAAAGGSEQPGDREPDLDPNIKVYTEGLPALHVACLHGQLATVQRLVDSGPDDVNSSGPGGRRPIHTVLSHQSSPNTSACLRRLLERGADVSATTDSGQTALHLAASEGLLDCTEMLVQAGADVLARDGMGHTPLDLARVWCHREVARYLKSCMWEANKRKEMERRKLVQDLYSNLVGVAKLNDHKKKMLTDEEMAEWANKKGLPPLKDIKYFPPRGLVSQYHTQCLSEQDSSKSKEATGQTGGPTKLPLASRPWAVYTGHRSQKPPREPNLRQSVTLWTDSSSGLPRYATKWDGTPRVAPDLPLDVLERVLFPRDFPPRIASPRDFEPRGILDTQHRGSPQGQSASPWTEVAMHLAEVLEPGHY